MIDVSSFAGAAAPIAYAPPSSLKFGTSGLRGLVSDLVGAPSRGYALAFIRHMLEVTGEVREIVIGRDLRSSSPEIVADCAAACAFAGLAAIDCGALSTPALAMEARRRGCPGIMVTGSHIPDDRNGLKFYSADGEITKEDEAGILAQHSRLGDLARLAACQPALLKPERDPVLPYMERYVDFFGANALEGMRIGVYEHSSVARDALIQVLRGLGAEVVGFGRSAHFIPVDTEAHGPDLLSLIERTARQGGYFAIVSTDGDADRPLVADEAGHVIRGDVLGLMVGALMRPDAIVTPVTSGSVIERSAIAGEVARTRVGSPYVIEGMKAITERGKTVIGFEANGGVLLGYDAVRQGRQLAALSTRDAFLPIIAAMILAKEAGVTVGQMVERLDVGFAVADRLKDVTSAASMEFLEKLTVDPEFQADFFLEAGKVVASSRTDGFRAELDNGTVIHYRASGNAPELRCYVEAMSATEAECLLAWGLRAAGGALQFASGRQS